MISRNCITASRGIISETGSPGDWKSPYIYLDREKTLAVVNQYLNPYVEDRTAEDLHIPG